MADRDLMRLGEPAADLLGTPLLTQLRAHQSPDRGRDARLTGALLLARLRHRLSLLGAVATLTGVALRLTAHRARMHPNEGGDHGAAVLCLAQDVNLVSLFWGKLLVAHSCSFAGGKQHECYRSLPRPSKLHLLLDSAYTLYCGMYPLYQRRYT